MKKKVQIIISWSDRIFNQKILNLMHPISNQDTIDLQLLIYCKQCSFKVDNSLKIIIE